VSGLAETAKENQANLRKKFQFQNKDSNRAAPEKSEALRLSLSGMTASCVLSRLLK